MAITEFSFSVDDFKTPKVYKDAEAIATLLVRLLLLEPGTIQSHPDMGVGLISKYRFSTEGSAATLQGEYQRQVEKYLPQFQGVQISVTEKDKKFKISVQIEDTLYGIYYDVNKTVVQSGYTKLTDL